MNPIHRPPSRPPRGFNLIELMIGMTVGLFILIGASSLMVGQIGDHRRLTLETRTEQDVRAIAEMMARDLRAAGVQSTPMQTLWSESNAAPAANPNADVTIDAGGTRVIFKLLEAGVTVRRGYQLADGVLYRLVESGGVLRSQPMTDPNTLSIAAFRVSTLSNAFSLESACDLPCNGAPDCPPKTVMRAIRIELEATAAHDNQVKRSLDFTVRNQADQPSGACRAV